MDDSVFNRIFSAATGVWTLVLMAAVTVFKAWPAVMGRINERYRDRAADEASDWDRLRAEIIRLDLRCDHLQNEVDECRRREGEWMQRAISSEAAAAGLGHARQEAAIIEATKRIEGDKP